MAVPLAGAERVDFEARSVEGEVLFSHRDVPFDPERGEVVLAWQVHYRALPMTSHFRVKVRATDRAGAERVSDYTLDHEFEIRLTPGASRPLPDETEAKWP